MGRLLTPANSAEGLAGAGLDERGECVRGKAGGGVAPHAGRRHIAVDLGVDLLHGQGQSFAGPVAAAGRRTSKAGAAGRRTAVSARVWSMGGRNVRGGLGVGACGDWPAFDARHMGAGRLRAGLGGLREGSLGGVEEAHG